VPSATSVRNVREASVERWLHGDCDQNALRYYGEGPILKPGWILSPTKSDVVDAAHGRGCQSSCKAKAKSTALFPGRLT